MDLKYNKYQTPFDKKLRDSLPKKVVEQMVEYINTVPLIKYLISPETSRGYAKDRPKDNKGKIIVDITKPHILENMDFFRERALFYEKNGVYTNLIPNPNPKSEYARFWKEEVRRWKEGHIRASDGEWIPGYLYFYWNYSPIWLFEATEEVDEESGRQQGERVRKFPKPWLGDYLYYHYIEQGRKKGLHGKLLKTRGVGFSFKMGAISPCNMYTLPGTGNVNFHLASDKTFLTGDKGVFGKVVDVLDWIAETTPLPRIRLTNSLKGMEIQMGYLDEYGVKKGLLSSVFGISLKHSPQKARGIRGPLIHYEEDGLFPDLEEAWGVNIRAVESGTGSFGYMLAGGTGGTEGAGFEGSKKLFYNPSNYHIYGVPNVYDKNINGKEKSGFFWGAYMNRENCYDEVQGEPDVIKAMVEVLMNRYEIAVNANDPAALTQARAEEPITPQEAIMRTQGTLFPIADLSDLLDTIRPVKTRFVSEHYVGNLIYDSVLGVKWEPNADVHPIRGLEYDKMYRGGAVEIFELPKTNRNGKIQSGRYIAGIDPIDADEGKSLFSIFVMDLLTDRVVAEYTGRHPKAEQCYEEALKLCIFYNAQALYESNLKGVYSYFKQRNSLQYLADTPEILKDMDFVKANIAANKGVRVNQQINSWGRQLQVSWMLTKAYTSSEDESPTINLHRLRSIGYIEECIAWNPDGNFDRVSSMSMLMILREERMRTMEGLRKKDDVTVSSWANSDFFNQFGHSKKKIKGDINKLFKQEERTKVYTEEEDA